MVDAHNHLHELKKFSDFSSILQRISDSGVRKMICNATSIADITEVEHLLVLDSVEVVPAFGIHPWYVKNQPDWEKILLEALFKYPKSIIGETGLDRYKKLGNEKIQELCFRKHLELGVKLQRPVVIHCVRAWDWLCNILNDTKILPPALLFHAYSGGPELINFLLKKNGWFSFAGTVLHENNIRSQNSIKSVPRERLLLETDSPDLLAPEPYRLGLLVDPETGKIKSEPSDLRLILTGVSNLLRMQPFYLEILVESNLEIFLAAGN